MSCPDPGTVRAFIDGELAPSETSKVQEHLEACASCAKIEISIKETSATVCSQLDLMAPRPSECSADSAKALAVLKGRMARKDSVNERFKRRLEVMSNFLSQTKWRFGILASASILLVVLVAFTPAGTAAENFLSVFRVQRIQTVALDSTNIQNPPTLSDLGIMDISGAKAEARSVSSAAEASAAAGFPVILPSALPSGFNSNSEINVTDGMNLKFTFDLPKIQSYLSAAGIRGIDLPQNLNGAIVQAQFSPAVMVAYRSGNKLLEVGMTKSPVVDVPSDLNVDYLREQLLKFPGLSTQTRDQLKSIQDWKSTVVVPVPRGGASRDVSINGSDGVIISGPKGADSAVLWLRNDIVYGVSGRALSEEELLAVAQSIK